MTSFKGKGVCNGIAIGELYFFKPTKIDTSKKIIIDTKKEAARFEQAKQTAIVQLKQLYDKFLHEVGKEQALIFDIHQMMLEDEDYCQSVKDIISDEKVNAEYAINLTAQSFANMFRNMDDDYMKERAADVLDISSRLLHIITNTKQSSLNGLAKPVVLVADDLAPSQTIQMDKSKILGFVTIEGSTNSHTAILARTMDIPAVVAIKDSSIEKYDGQKAIINASIGEIYINPEQSLETKMLAEQKEIEKEKALLLNLRGKETKTKQGKKLMLYANAGSLDDIDMAIKNDAEGIGLFRSEFIYLSKNDFPTEQEQFEIYKKAAQKLNGKRLIIRTLDIGADKQVDYFNLKKEENPALGYRAIRICLTQIDIFKTQLRAIYRASAFGKVAIMFPMIISVEELQQCKRICSEIKTQLSEQNIDFDNNIEIGIMIETPAAVIISDKLAPYVDFFSIGTNDLTQYTLAIDRQNQMLEPFYNPHHEAILRMIELTTQNAHNAGIWVGICGELAADQNLLNRFIDMGIDELSVAPSAILPIRKQVIDY